MSNIPVVPEKWISVEKSYAAERAYVKESIIQAERSKIIQGLYTTPGLDAAVQWICDNPRF